MHYDATLKEIFHGAPQRLLELLTGSRSSEVLTVEYPSVRVRRPDLVVRLENGRLFHLELQSSGDPAMPWRMLEYYMLLARDFNEEPLQQVLYVGNQGLSIATRIEHEALQFRYRVLDIRELPGEQLLESGSLGDNLLAILCRLEDPRGAIRQILDRIGLLPGKAMGDALAKLVILSRLRGFRDLIAAEQRQMPIRIESDILDDPWLRDLVLERERQGEAKGEARGEARMLRTQLERRFGPLPEWALRRLETADTVALENWGLRLIEAASLEEVLQ